jgi:hypothetical protein
MPFMQLVVFLGQLVDAMIYLHVTRKILHRDVSCE